MRLVTLPRATVALGLVAIGCFSSFGPRPAFLEMILGDGQDGTVGQPFEVPLVVRVTDERGRGITNAEVTFGVRSGDAVFNGLSNACSPLLPTEIVSAGAGGHAGVLLTPLSVVPITVAVDVPDFAADPLMFTAEAGSAGLTLSKVSGDEQDGQETLIGLDEAFVARLTDGRGEPVAGVAVVWEVTKGEGELFEALNLPEPPSYPCPDPDLDTVHGTRTVRTLSNGTSGSSYYPEIAGINTVSARVAGVAGSPLTFTVDVIQGIWLSPIGLDPTDARVPLGATVRWRHDEAAARLISTSAPPGGASFDSGPLSHGEPFEFVPEVAGTWQYIDEVTGERGTLTVF